MHVLMLGWEFPPFITGGLGTACYGLTKALDAQGARITFVLPKSAGGEDASHVQMLSPQSEAAALPDSANTAGAASSAPQSSTPTQQSPQAAPTPTGSAASTDPITTTTEFTHTEFISVHSGFLHPYDPNRADQPVGAAHTTTSQSSTTTPGQSASAHTQSAATGSASSPAHTSAPPPSADTPTPSAAKADDYGGDIMTQCERYATFCVAAITQRKLDFDVVHAHDWMTYPAGLAIARLTGKPLVTHIHSTEFDRSGEHINQRIYDIERRGMHGAMRVVAVSQLTKNMVVSRYSVPKQRVEVVYNGVEFAPAEGTGGIQQTDKIVLYFGRITYQKGPSYFVRAAKRVLEKYNGVKFVVAGSGDLAQHMYEMANELGIGHKILFTGFLRGKDIGRVFSMADLYVMPSISEPFGIAPLEAMSHDVPVLISKSSGVSEVLRHALKVDFWDIDDMANKIVAVLRHPPLSSTLREHGAMEVRTITWDGAATRCLQVYNSVIDEMTHPPTRIETAKPKSKKSKKAPTPHH